MVDEGDAVGPVVRASGVDAVEQARVGRPAGHGRSGAAGHGRSGAAGHEASGAAEAGGPGAAPTVPGFELGTVLARGATSEVWAGVALDGGRRVAVKVVHAELEAVEAAAREAAVSARAADAHVVAVEAALPLPDGRVALVMPQLLGGALDALVRARGHLSPGEVVTVLAPLASALGRLHALGVVHGDVSPGNVLLDLDGRPVLGDLGLGHVVGEVSPGVWGTDGYVAPEVLLGGDPTAGSDVYSLGALGWLCLSGTVPGPPGLRPELAEVSRAGEGSQAVVAALAAAVAAEPADRPSAHELAWRLFEAAQAEPLHLVEGDDAVSSVTYRLRAAAGRPPVAATPSRWRRRREQWRATLARPTPPARPARPTPAARPARSRGGGRHVAAAPGRRAGRSPAGRVPGAAAALPALLGVLVVAVLVLVVAGLGRGSVPATAAADPRTNPRMTASPATDDPRTATRTTKSPATDDPRSDPESPRSRPLELLAVLAEARATAWRRADPGLLAAADAPGSVAAARDAAAVAEVARAGVRYVDLWFTVVEASTVSASAQDAVLRARIDAGAYVVTGPSGATPRPAVPGPPVLVDLVRTEAGWRVSAVRPAP